MTGPPPVVQVPDRPTGVEIAHTLRQLRLAVFRGDVVVDGGALETWPAGARLALHQCEQRAAQRGHRFEVQSTCAEGARC